MGLARAARRATGNVLEFIEWAIRTNFLCCRRQIRREFPSGTQGARVAAIHRLVLARHAMLTRHGPRPRITWVANAVPNVNTARERPGMIRTCDTRCQAQLITVRAGLAAQAIVLGHAACFGIVLSQCTRNALFKRIRHDRLVLANRTNGATYALDQGIPLLIEGSQALGSKTIDACNLTQTCQFKSSIVIHVGAGVQFSL